MKFERFKAYIEYLSGELDPETEVVFADSQEGYLEMDTDLIAVVDSKYETEEVTWGKRYLKIGLG